MAVRTAEGHVEWETHTTWYRIVGELDPRAALAPLVIAHGGPGCDPRLRRPDRRAARAERAGLRAVRPARLRPEPAPAPTRPPTSGRSTSSSTSCRRCSSSLGIAGRYHVLGQSWGGMLAMEYALDHPQGLLAIVVADSPAQHPAVGRRGEPAAADLPARTCRTTLTRTRPTGTTDDPAYEAADGGLLPPPPVPAGPVARGVDAPRSPQMAEDPTVYHTMNGPSEFHCIGTPEGVGHHRPAARDRRADAARLRPLRRGDAAHRRADRRARSRAAAGCCSRSRATRRTSRSRRRSGRPSRGSWRRSIGREDPARPERADDVHRALAERAAREGTTMSELVRRELPRLVRRPSMEEVLARILSRSPVGGPPAAELIRQARAERTEGD